MTTPFPLSAVPQSRGSGERVRPAGDSPRGNFTATVVQNRTLCTDHFRLTLSIADFPASHPGQFVQLDCRDPSAEPDEPRVFDWPPAATVPSAPGAAPGVRVCDADFAAPIAYLRRPFSIADHRTRADGRSEIDIIHRVVGRGTSHLARLQPGQTLSLLGPLGVGFTAPEEMETACLVGGGVGIPPMLYLAKALAGHAARRVAFFGAQRQDLLAVTLAAPPPATGEPAFTVAELSRYNCPASITTDDGSLGMKGFVTQSLRAFLAGQAAQRSVARAVVYCCGPTPMMKATAKVAAEFGVPCQVSLEQPMACGMGTCQSCIIRWRPRTAAAETEWKYKLTCTEGPVFDTRDIVW